jgi:hypothetical protein
MVLEGEIKAMVRYDEQNAQLRQSLLERDWMQVMRLDWSSICTVARQTKPKEIVAKFPVF